MRTGRRRRSSSRRTSMRRTSQAGESLESATSTSCSSGVMLRLLHDFRRGTEEGGFVSILSPQLLAEKSRNVLLVVSRSMTCQGLNESLHDVRDGRRGISFSVVVLDCVCVCLKKCGEEYCVWKCESPMRRSDSSEPL